MPIPIPLIVAGLGALGSFLGNRKGSRTSQIDQTQFRDLLDTVDVDQNILEELLPFLTGEQAGLQSALIGGALNQLNRPGVTADDIITQGIFNINRGSEARRTALGRSLAARGLSRSPAAAAAIAGVEGQRIGDITQLRSQAPIIADQQRQQNLQLANLIFGNLPKGQTRSRTGTTRTTSRQTGTTRITGTNVGAGSAFGSSLGTIGGLLARFLGAGLLGQPGGGDFDISDIINDLDLGGGQTIGG